jgi:LCP family protein required for cell wall assembly
MSETQKIDASQENKGKKKKTFLSKRVYFIVIFILIVIGLFFAGKYLFKKLKGPQLAYSVITGELSALNSSSGRTNILVLGTGGANHIGGDLTDTMIFVSIDLEKADAVLVSLPRDIWSKRLQAKINTAYHYGEEKKDTTGFELADKVVEDILNQPIHYTVLVDFQGFVDFIDLLGGIEVEVKNSFDDYKYPIPGKENAECPNDPEYQCRYEHLHFEAGRQHMDGERALKFVRSRHAEGDEGTDFARSQRQQQVMLAVKRKLLSYKTLLNPNKLLSLKKSFSDNVHFHPEISQKEIGGFVKLFREFAKAEDKLETIALDTGNEEEEGFLKQSDTNKYGQWVLEPRSGGWQEFQKHLENELDDH